MPPKPSITDFFGRRPLLGRILMRELSVLFFRDLVATGLTVESALARTAKAFTFSASESSVRRWNRAYTKAGSIGLTEHKLGRSGRKNFASAVPRCGAGANPQTPENCVGFMNHRAADAGGRKS